MKKFQDTAGSWADTTFDQATPRSICAHLSREVVELTWEVENSDAVEIEAEAADCLLLLIHLSHKTGFDLLAAAKKKFAINQARTWGKPDAEGVVEHVR